MRLLLVKQKTAYEMRISDWSSDVCSSDLLGTRLLQRTTRHVQPTVEGEIYYRRCMAILADIEDADRSASGAVTGLLRVDVAGNLARTMLLPALPAFLAQHPSLTVHLREQIGRASGRERVGQNV